MQTHPRSHIHLALVFVLATAAFACDDADVPAHADDAESRDADFEAARVAAEAAEAVFTGQVTEVAYSISEPDADGQRLPFTLVTWTVDDAIKGVTPQQSYTARFLGGPLGDAVLEVTETPQFAIGDVDLLFVTDNGESGCPLVGGAEGRIQIERASGRADGLSKRAPDRHWVEALTEHLHDSGVGDGAERSMPVLDQPFTFAGPVRATDAERRAAAERTRIDIAAAAPTH